MSAGTSTTWLTPRLIVGLLIVLFGMALMLDNLGLMDAGDLIRYWPFGLILIGLMKMLQDRSRSSRISGALICAVGILFAMEVYFSVRLDVWRWWPIAIIVFGILIVSRAFSSERQPDRLQVGLGFPDAAGRAPRALRPGTVEQKMSEFAIWSGIERRVSSPSFKQADLTAIMGGIEFDLRQAGTDQGEAVIDVFVIWGGIEIIVPPDWAVSNQVTAIMGGAEDQSTGTQAARHRLVVRGVVIMGGVDIKT